jgi:hypothetical protein
VLVTVHLILAPLLLPLRALSVGLMRLIMAHSVESILEDPNVTTKTLVVVRAPADGSVAYTLVEPAALGEGRPRRLRLLASGLAPIRVTRVDERTLEVRPAQGFYSTEGERMLRGPSRPFRSGEEVQLSDLQVVVTEVDAAGRALEAEFRFERELEDASLLWYTWRDSGLKRYVPPPVGATHTLPAIRLATPLRAR